MMSKNKNIIYASQISESIANLFREDDCKTFCNISLEELNEKDNLTEFFIGYLKAGTLIFNEFTGKDKNILEFTHILNQLCVQDLLDKED